MELHLKHRLDPDASKVVKRLRDSGFQAYLVGGCVRDLLLDRNPKDYDVATSATPQQIKSVFPSCRIIGRRFRLAHVRVGGKIIETATFRADPRKRRQMSDTNELLIRHDNVFGSETEDAKRRDFTVNGLFYDIVEDKVIDHVNGITDLEAGLMRTIGDPSIRFREDPVRMLRAVKFAARLGFEIEAETADAICENRREILKSSNARVLEEIFRILRCGHATSAMTLMIETGLLAVLSPRLASLGVETEPDDREALGSLDKEERQWHETWSEDSAELAPIKLSFLEDADLEEARAGFWQMLGEMDKAVKAGTELTSATILASLILPFLWSLLSKKNLRLAHLNSSITELMQPLNDELRIARRDNERVRQILLSQKRLAAAKSKNLGALPGREHFTEAVILHKLDCEARGIESNLDASYLEVAEKPSSSQRGKQRKRRRGGRRRRRGSEARGEA